MTWFALTGDTRIVLTCASSGCWQQPTWRLEVDGTGSNYCSGCKQKIGGKMNLRAQALPSGRIRLIDDLTGEEVAELDIRIPSHKRFQARMQDFDGLKGEWREIEAVNAEAAALLMAWNIDEEKSGDIFQCERDEIKIEVAEQIGDEQFSTFFLVGFYFKKAFYAEPQLPAT
jgi:hypothetical protein